MKLLLPLLLLLSSINLSAQDIVGDWNGLLSAPNAKIRLVFHIKKTIDGYISTMDSPDQNAKGIPVSTTSFENSVIKLNISSAGIQYEGILGQDQMIKGDFKQAGMTFPLNLSKTWLDAPIMRRPQMPSKPYSYLSEDVEFSNKSAGANLAGTLTLPAKEGSFPAVILISGSGPQNRDEELLGHKPFLVLSDYLTKNGIAVLRFDDRGVAKSTGAFASATTNDFATDVEAALEYLSSRKEIDKKSMGLIGHSEGGVIAPIVAAKRKEVAFIVLLAGTGVPGGEILMAQGEMISRASGMPEEQLARAMKVNRNMIEMIKASKDSATLSKDLFDYYLKTSKESPDVQKPANMTDEEFMRPQIRQYTSPWMINFVKYDPFPVLEKVRCPVLALNGSKDLQVPSAQNLAAIKKGLEKGGNKSVTTKELPGLNHLFQETKTGLPNEYGEIEQTFSPVALTEISSWILKQVGKK